MTPPRSNIVLVGMPGSGKSTVGVLLSKLTRRGFVDTDVLIQSSTGRALQDIVDEDGHIALRRIEEDVLVGLSVRNNVIATGGSAVYSERAMEHLKAGGVVVFLKVSMATLVARVKDYETRGLAKRKDQTLADLFAERSALYGRYADITIECDGAGHDAVCSMVTDALEGFC